MNNEKNGKIWGRIGCVSEDMLGKRVHCMKWLPLYQEVRLRLERTMYGEYLVVPFADADEAVNGIFALRRYFVRLHGPRAVFIRLREVTPEEAVKLLGYQDGDVKAVLLVKRGKNWK